MGISNAMPRSRTLYRGGKKIAEFQDDNLIWADESHCMPASASSLPCPQIMRDIEPYKSMITGEMITSRSVHRTHLRDHRCIEIGNEKQVSKPIIPKNDNRKRLLASQMADMSEKQVQKMVKAEIKARRPV